MKHLMVATFLILLSIVAPDAFAGELFDSKVPLEFTVHTDFKKLVNDYNPSNISGTLSFKDKTQLKVNIDTYGELRAAMCNFPMLKITRTDPTNPSKLISEKQTLYMVTHCDGDGQEFASKNDSLVVREYLAYEIYRIISKFSLNVRMAKVKYQLSNTKSVTRLAFLVENAADVADQFRIKKSSNTYDHRIANYPSFRLFQNLISNADWGLGGHNTFQFEDSKNRILILPYDFNQSNFASDVPAYVYIPHESAKEYLRVFNRMEKIKPNIHALIARWKNYLAPEISKKLNTQVNDFFRNVGADLREQVPKKPSLGYDRTQMYIP